VKHLLAYAGLWEKRDWGRGFVELAYPEDWMRLKTRGVGDGCFESKVPE